MNFSLFPTCFRIRKEIELWWSYHFLLLHVPVGFFSFSLGICGAGRNKFLHLGPAILFPLGLLHCRELWGGRRRALVQHLFNLTIHVLGNHIKHKVND